MTQTGEVDLGRLKGMSILLAEDNVTNQMVASQMLESLGAEVDIASDGAIALERLKSRAYDVLLIDIEMPRVSGLDVIRAIRADQGALSSSPVIALTAYALREHREKIDEAGADGLIPKPILSIKQFGADILSHVDACGGRDAERGASASGGSPEARIERALYDSFAESLGPEAMASILDRVETDMVAQRREIADALDARDADRMARASHILTSLAGMVGGVRLQRQAERLNALSSEKNMDEAATLAAQCLPEADGVLAFVRAERRALDE